MSEIPEFLDQNEPSFESGGEMSMVETWIAAFTKPNEATFAEIAAQPGATLGKALLWALLGTFLSAFGSTVAQLFSAGRQFEGLMEFLPPELAREIPMDVAPSLGISSVICGAPLGAIVGVIVFAIITALVQWIAKLFGGTGSFEKLAYTFAAIMVPYSAISAVLSLLGAIPFVGILTGLVSFGLLFYVIFLEVQAIKAVNGIDTAKALGAILLPGLVIFVFVCCCVVISLTLLGPVIGDVFSEIQQGLY